MTDSAQRALAAIDDLQAEIDAFRIDLGRKLDNLAKLVRESQFPLPLITRDEALAQGLHRFFDGIPCRKRGHISERWVSGKHGTCIACDKLSNRKRPGDKPDPAFVQRLGEWLNQQ